MESGPCSLFVSASASRSPALDEAFLRRIWARQEEAFLWNRPQGVCCGLGFSLDCAKLSK